jgi:hypothetical protein
MLWHSLRKIPDKINERIVNLSRPFSIRISNHVHTRTVFATFCIAIVVVLGTITALFGASNIASYANSVRGFGAQIYWDQGCTNRTLSFDWGSIEPGLNKTLTVYIRNEGDSAACLSMATSNWAPSAALSYMTLNWNYSGQILNVDQVIPLELILAVSLTISGITHFSFDTTIATTS